MNTAYELSKKLLALTMDMAQEKTHRIDVYYNRMLSTGMPPLAAYLMTLVKFDLPTDEDGN